ncbi:MAG: pilus assembly protein, partial [Rhodospirillales bacterium]|nr:pilus assembly protein [Rhodospirillales bacterium]
MLRDTSGAVAVEFALILPVLITMIMGTIELTNFLTAQRKILAAAQTISDLISQETDVTSTDLDDLIAAGKMVLRPMNTSLLSVGVASVRFDASSTPSVDWTHSLSGGAVANATTLATPVAQANSSVIIVYASYSYTPITGSLILSSRTLSETSITRPRTVSYVSKY